ncbi:PWWP domain-containing DNA repair factor 3A [Elgaria multicarinata webbii]|uniref:PWWP domain-containing DNA repair factor 3A n=1 Tax=Elgaria multicarinata webbii TaxID=159646 RepID=UPI002FCD2DC8
MTEAEYILCKWKKRLWPAKVLSRSCPSRGRRLGPRSASVRVEILGLNKQASVRCADTEALKKESIEDIASKLDQSKKNPNPVEELTYRRALRDALDILGQGAPSKGEPPSKGRSVQKDTQERTLPFFVATRQRQLSSPEDPRERETEASSVGALTPPRVAWLEDERVEGKSGGGSSSPSPAAKRLAQTSTPLRVSRRRLAQLAPAGPKSDTRPGLRSHLICLPAKCVSTESEAGESPPRKYGKVSDGSRCRTGRCWKLNGTASSPSRKRWGRGRPENLNSGPSAGTSPSEHGGEDKGEPSRHPGFEDEEGLEFSSDLRVSPVRELRLSPAFRDDEEEDEEEELPSFLLHQEPCSIEQGMLVWCKLARYPYWPAVVKRVKKKDKKANVVLIEKSVDDKSKGFSVPLRNLKHFDCEDKQKLIDKAGEEYNQEINWCIRLIADYRIRVGCHSFAGSFLEYCADDMSCPVRKEALHPSSQLAFPQAAETPPPEEPPVEATPTKLAKKVLPDRMRAARDRANERIVDFIVKAKGADAHLHSILRSKKPSRWLAGFLDAGPYVTCIETYLEDDAQQDVVVNYLQKVYQEALPLVNGDGLKFILEVLFPEAIIYAISAVYEIDYKKAEAKYIEGPRVTHRERENFEELILEKKRRQQRQSQELPTEDGL